MSKISLFSTHSILLLLVAILTATSRSVLANDEADTIIGADSPDRSIASVSHSPTAPSVGSSEVLPAGVQPYAPRFQACRASGLILVKEDQAAKLPTNHPGIEVMKYVGNFGSVNEINQRGTAKVKGFVNLVSGKVRSLELAEVARDQSIIRCLKPKTANQADPSCVGAQQELQKDLQLVRDNWHDMRMGLVLGFEQLPCSVASLQFCNSYNTVIKQPFHAADFKIERPFDFTWLTDLTMAPPLSLEAAGTSSQRVRYSSDRNKPGMLTLAEVDEAEREIKKVIAPIAGRTYVDISAYAPNDSGYDNSPEAQRARDEAIELRRAGPNGISFREAQKQRYYRAISKSPLMIFLPRPNPSVDELIKAYGEKLSLAQERLNELSSNATTIGLDHSERDKLIEFTALIESTLRQRPNDCPIAEEMLREKVKLDMVKNVGVMGAASITGVACLFAAPEALTGCALVGLALTAQGVNQVMQESFDEKVQVVTMSGEFSATVDDWMKLSKDERSQFMQIAMLPLASLDGVLVARAGVAGAKAAGRSIGVMSKQFERFRETFIKLVHDFAATQKVPTSVAQKVLRVILTGPNKNSILDAKKILDLIARAGKVSEKNAQAVSLAARLASEVVDESMNAEQWAHAISEAAEDPEALASLVDILRNTRLLREARTTVEQSVSVREAVELAVERQVSRVYTRDGQIIGDKERADLANQLKQCIFKR